MLDLTTYCYINAKTRAMLSQLISPAVFNNLLESRDIYEMSDYLQNTPYKSLPENAASEKKGLDIFESTMCKYDISIHSKILHSISTKREKNFVSLLLERYEIEQLKTILRIWHNKIPVILDDYIIEEHILHDINYKKIAMCPTLEEIIFELNKAPYKKALLAVRDVYKEKKSSFFLESALDIDFYQRLKAQIDKFPSTDKNIAKKILGIEIDIENINWLIRFRKYYSLSLGDMLSWVIPGGDRISKDTVRQFYTTDGLSKIIEGVALGPYAKIKNMAEDNVHTIEYFLHEILLHEVHKTLAGYPFTIGTILGYLILKRWETRRIISIAYAKHLGLGKEKLGALVG